jgi:succinate dehydrogenase / fumarate reductase cytochrome b subunit
MLVSILHRATGVALALGGGVLLAWWLTAAAAGPKSYATFYAWVVDAQPGVAGQHVVNILATLVGIGLTWALFQHMATGVRHFVLDVGAGYELKTNRTGAWATIVFSLIATALFWFFVRSKY